MKSASSLNKNQFARAFKTVFRRKIIGAVIVFALSLIASIAISTVTVFDYLFDSYNVGTVDITSELRTVIYVVSGICIVYNLFLAAGLFKEIYSKRACDYYFALPVKRGTAYFANVVFAFAVNILTFICSSAARYMCMLGFQSEKISFVVDKAVYFAGTASALASVLCVLSFLILCAVSAGRKVHYVILSVISIGGIDIILNGIKSNLEYIWGLKIDEAAAFAISPIGSLKISSYSESVNEIAFLAAVGIIEAVAVAVLGYAVFAKRKAESAEVSLSGGFVEQAFLLVLLLAAFSAVRVNNLWGMIIFGIICAVIFSMIYNAVFFKKAFTKQSSVTLLAACTIGVAFLICVFIPSHDKFISYVPEQQEIEYVEITGREQDYYAASYASSSINYLIEPYYGGRSYDTLKLSSEEAVEKTVAFHKKLIEKETIEKSNYYISTDFSALFGQYQEINRDCCCDIVYTLKDGSRVKRTYYAAGKCVEDEFADLMKTDEALSSMEPFSIKSDDILFVCIEDFTTEEAYDENSDDWFSGQSVVNISDYDEFSGILKNDYKNTDKYELFSNFSYEGLGFCYYDYEAYFNTLYYVNFYSISDNAPPEVREKLKSMSVVEIQSLYSRYMLMGYNKSNDAYYINCYVLGVSDSQQNTVEYIQNELL